MDGGGIKIGDFGLACWQNNSSKVHHCIGTESYAAPEQFHGGDCSSKVSNVFNFIVFKFQIIYLFPITFLYCVIFDLIFVSNNKI